MEENEFKKLSANSRDWLIYKLLSEASKDRVIREFRPEGETGIKSEHVSGVNLEKEIPALEKGETTVEETVTGKVVLVTDKAVLIGVGDRVAWFPKSIILNLDKIVLDKDKTVELKIVDWFKYKIEWKVPQE